MDIDVQQDTYIPNTSENLIYRALKNTKVSFVLLLMIVIAIYICIFFLLGNTSSENSSSSPNVFVLCLEVVLWVMLIIVVYINFQNYDAKNYDFKAKMENLFNEKIATLNVNAVDVSGVEQQEEEQQEEVCQDTDSSKEVFHITNNKYTYRAAKDACEEYDARLATYDEIERAYNNGANWCSYGWSKDQLALFPTQKQLYNELKKIPGHEHDCGRAGINGGFIDNPNVKFGANCYGIKPKAKEDDKSHMHAINHSPNIKNGMTMDQLKKKRQEKYIIAPFHKDLWSIKS